MYNAALYIRVSTTEQIEFSPDAQRRILLDYAEKNDFIVSNDNIYLDEGISGRKAEKRPAFMKMISDAKTVPKPFDIILVHKFDRFARSREDSIVYKSLLRKECGIKVISITEQIDDDKFSIILESMLEAMAEYYSLNLSDEVKKGMTEKALRGTLHSSPCFGYRIKNGKMEIDEYEAKIIVFIFNEYLNNDSSFFSIAEQLINMGVKTRKGNFFQSRNITYILQNKTYAGYMHWTPTKIVKCDFNNSDTIIRKGDFEAIINEAIFDKVQKKYNENKRITSPKSKPIGTGQHWLSGILRCSSCGHTLVRQNDSKRKYALEAFQCSYYLHGTCKISHRIPSHCIEKAILEELKYIMDNISDVKFKKDIITIKTDNEINKLEKQLKNIKTKKQRLKQAYVNEIDTLEEYKQSKEILEKQEKEILQKISFETTEKNNLVSYNTPSDEFKIMYETISTEMSVKLKQKSIRNIVSKIIFDKYNNSIEIHYLF